MSITVHPFARPDWDANLVARWRQVPTAIVADMSEGTCLLNPMLRPLKPAGAQPRLFGFAVTARCEPPDFGAVLLAIDGVAAGDVLVIDAQGHESHAVIGGILGGQLHRKGAAGIVCNGAIRDVAELAAFEGFSVYGRHITPRGPTGIASGAVNAAIVIDGTSVAPGDLIIGDSDGLVVLSPENATRLIVKAEAKLALEDEWQTRLKAGQPLKTIFNL